MKIILVSNTSLTIRNFRVALMEALRSKGHEVIFCAQDNGYAAEVAGKGFAFVPLSIDRKGANLFTDLKQVFALYRLYKNERPDIVLHYTIKPNIYGSIAASIAGIPSVNNVTGLGYVFIKKSFLYPIVKLLYKVACALAERTFFQNEDDLNLFLQKGIIDKKKAVLTRGSGVDMDFFSPDHCRSIKKEEGYFTFLFTGRLLWDKGIGELVNAARSTKQRHPKARFWLAGLIDNGNPSGINRKTIEDWQKEGVITYWGEVNDIRSYICRADCVVLPSYREGVPRSILEAMAMGKPIITTNAAGCREVIEDGVNGFSVPSKDWQALSDSFCRMIEMSSESRLKMGVSGIEKARREFEESIVIGKYLKEIESIAG